MTSFARQIGRAIIEKSKTKGRPMVEDESKALITASLFGGDSAEADAALTRISPIYAILSSRIKATFNGDVDVMARFFVSQLAGGSPGNAVLMTAVLYELSDGGKHSVTVQDVVDAFPMNVPSNEVFGEVWDTQKGFQGPKSPTGNAYDNALDHGWAWDESVNV